LGTLAVAFRLRSGPAPSSVRHSRSSLQWNPRLTRPNIGVQRAARWPRCYGSSSSNGNRNKKNVHCHERGSALTRSRGRLQHLTTARTVASPYCSMCSQLRGFNGVRCSTGRPDGHAHRECERWHRAQHRAMPSTERTTKRAHCFSEGVMQAMAELAVRQRRSSSPTRRTSGLDVQTTLYKYVLEP
jgi:hypothetical protein